MLGEIAHPGMQRAEFVKLAKHQAHHLLHWLIGIKGEVPRCVPQIANRQAKSSFASPSLIEFALIHPLFDQVELCFTHGPLETCKIKHHILVKILPSSADTSR